MTHRPQTTVEAFQELNDALSEAGRAIRQSIGWRDVLWMMLIAQLFGIVIELLR